MTWSSSTCRRAKPLLGTLVEIAADGASRSTLRLAMDTAFALIAHIHATLSRQNSASDLSRFLAAPVGEIVKVDPHTVAVVAEGLRLAHETEGAFNPCVDASEFRHRADFTLLECADAMHLVRRGPLQLDLDGIAKGYAVDCAIEALRAHGVEQMLVNAGGDLRIEGVGPQPVEIRDPRNPLRIGAKVWIENEALATSAAYDVPPRLAVAADWFGCWSVSVAAPRAIHADALTKVALNLEPAVAATILRRYDAEAWWIREDGKQRNAA